MAKRRQWERTKFDTEEEIIRAIGMRAALEGVTHADVINAALRAYLAKEIAEVRKRMKSAAEEGGDEPPAPRHKRGGSE